MVKRWHTIGARLILVLSLGWFLLCFIAILDAVDRMGQQNRAALALEKRAAGLEAPRDSSSVTGGSSYQFTELQIPLDFAIAEHRAKAQKYEDEAERPLMALLVIPVLFLMFLVIRYIIDGSIRPLFPLKNPKASTTDP